YFGSFYLISRNTQNFHKTYNIVVTGVILVILPLSWILTDGTKGGTSYFIFIIIISVYTLAGSKIRKYFLILLLLVVLYLLYTEYNRPELILKFENPVVRYISVSIYFLTVLTATVYYLRLYYSENVRINKRLSKKNIILKLATEQSLEQQKIIESQNEELIRKNKELELAAEAKDRFYSIIAHDLKNSFNVLLGFSQIINTASGNRDCEKIEEYSGFLYDSSDKTYHLLLNLLEWARNQSSKIEYHPEKISLKEIFEELTDFFKYHSLSKNVAIKNMIEDCEVYADKNMLITVIRNLISNSLKFTENADIILRNKKDGDSCIIFIEDQGKGMSEEQIKTVFSKNYSFTKGTKGEIGSGIGLKLCKEFIKVNKGKLFIDSKLGEGSIFSFTVPLFK
ncbi:MAG: HAMP domain-containing histidine kinase, partial [Chlorobi bacterium]|nr:HAMP domain-containing histidine kinase [Chlorobiota bacterium]